MAALDTPPLPDKLVTSGLLRMSGGSSLGNKSFDTPTGDKLSSLLGPLVPNIASRRPDNILPRVSLKVLKFSLEKRTCHM